MTLAITPVYAALLAVFYVALSFHVILTRARTDVPLGDAGNPDLLAAIRRHGNMTEYVPFALLIMAFAELTGTGATWLHAAGIALVGGRLVHPFGLATRNPILAARIAGTLATFAAILLPAAHILLASLT